MPSDKWLNSTEFIWCPGCPVTWLTVSLAKKFDQWGLQRNNTWVVSGIGCAGRVSGYFNCNSAHTTHGRAIPVAEGIKLSSPKKDVFVVSGDGDLVSIGLSHLIHTARRNTPLKVICVNNFIYGMTGGQSSPLTSAKLETKSYPFGTPYTPLPIGGLLKTFNNIYYQEVKAFDSDGLVKSLDELYNHQGLGFVNLQAVCVTNDPRLKKARSPKHEIRNQV